MAGTENLSEIEDRMYTVKEVAVMFQVTEHTVRQWLTASPARLQGFKVGKGWRISKAQLQTLANEQVG